MLGAVLLVGSAPSCGKDHPPAATVSTPPKALDAERESHTDTGAKEAANDTPEPPSNIAFDRIAARHILIAWRGAAKAPPSVHRSKGEALHLAQKVQAEAHSGADFAALARKYSDGPSGPRGGFLGAFGRGVMVPAFEKAAFALKVGEVSDVVETPFGYHIIKREPLVEVHIAHIVVQWEGLRYARPGTTKEEALARAEEALAKLKAGEAVDEVAKRYSDGPAAVRGGDLGWFQKGQMSPDFDKMAFALKPGEVSDLIESSNGYHILVRLK